MSHDGFVQCSLCITDYQHLPMSCSKYAHSDLEMTMLSYLKAIQGTLAVVIVGLSWSFWKKTVTVP
jgi:hypothetical protein